jgi:two-component system phosphate regulon sensor histidine kinase PhoR
MRSSTTRLLIILIAVTMAAIIALQAHWLQKTYAFEKNEFNTSVIKSIRGLYEDIDLSGETGSHLSSLIEHPSPNSFIFQIDKIPLRDSLLFYLKNEFDDFDVYTDCKLAVYDGEKGRVVYESYIPAAGSLDSTDQYNAIPLFKKDYKYISLYFPHRSGYIITQMNRWILTSIFLLVLLLGFSMAVYYVFRQKFLNEVQKDFMNNVTHEFSTPLTVIELSTDALSKPSTLGQPEKVAKYAMTIRHQSDYLKKHIQNLIHTVVAENYTFTLSKSFIIPNELIKQAVLQLDPIVQEKKGMIETDLEPDNLKIEADYDNLYLAIFNIINNALKYSDQPHVKISTAVNNSHFEIRIKDNGIGIEKDDLKKIFRKFYRAQKGNLHNSKGLGLGLYFAKKVISLHNGSIHVNSITGIGTDFKIELPLNTSKNGYKSKNSIG